MLQEPICEAVWSREALPNAPPRATPVTMGINSYKRIKIDLGRAGPGAALLLENRIALFIVNNEFVEPQLFLEINFFIYYFG